MKQQQQRLISIFSFAFLTSLAPLTVYALISIFEHTLFTKHLETPLLFLILLKIKSAILHGYSSLLSFSLMMITLNAIYKAVWILVPKKADSFENFCTLPTIPQKEDHPKGKRFQRMLFIILSYGIIYLSFRNVGLFPHDPSQTYLTPKTFDPFIGNGVNGILTTRVLEQEESFALTQSRQDSDLKTLSIGKTLSFLNINPNSILVSKTGKLAFVITKYYGRLKIIDISNHLSPSLIGYLDLTKITEQGNIKTLKLSADEKTLFATTTQYLEIINVTNPQSPSLISSLISFPLLPSHKMKPYCMLPVLGSKYLISPIFRAQNSSFR